MIRTVNDLLQRLGLFERAIFPSRAGLYQRLTEEQHPEILFITCSDSRIMPELLFQSQPGEVFIARNPGNIVPPRGSGPDATAPHSNSPCVRSMFVRSSSAAIPTVAR